jgi:hypothetical protein
MQASKIKVGEVYAIKRDGEFVRLQVTAVVTRRINNHNNPHDYESSVEGRIVEDANNTIVTVASGAVFGPYEEQVELAERNRQEKEAKAQAEEAVRQRTSKLRDLLYTKLGVDLPDHERSFEQPFRTGSWGEVEIRKNGVQLLIDYLETH